MLNETLPLKGKLSLTLTNEHGEVKDSREINNLIVQVGKNFLASAVINSSTSPFTYMAIGTSGTAATTSDTALGSQLVRQVFSSSSVSTNVVTLSTTYAAGTGTGALQEAGIFNASSGGTMLSHVVFSVINKGASDTLTITWTITVG
jgi:hypothetical protein